MVTQGVRTGQRMVIEKKNFDPPPPPRFSEIFPEIQTPDSFINQNWFEPQCAYGYPGVGTAPLGWSWKKNSTPPPNLFSRWKIFKIQTANSFTNLYFQNFWNLDTPKTVWKKNGGGGLVRYFSNYRPSWPTRPHPGWPSWLQTILTFIKELEV